MAESRVARGCPLSEEARPYRCRYCPLPPKERIKACNFYQGQITSRVPWWRDTQRWKKEDWW